jgi:CRP/FNR family transcriptional regulator, dissimilatory nitrate respiration regulator
MENIFNILAKTNIFNGISPLEIKSLFSGKTYRVKEYARDEYIAYSDDTCYDMLILLKGSVRGEMTDFTGKKLKIEDIMAPRPLAIAFIFGHENRYPVDIIANEQSAIIIIPRDVIVFLLQHSQVILQNYLNAISSRTQFLSNRIRFLSFKKMKEKIAFYILNHINKDSNTLTLNQTQTELADFFGVTRPSLARALKEMEEEGILQARRREIKILDKEKMNKLLTKQD